MAIESEKGIPEDAQNWKASVNEENVPTEREINLKFEESEEGSMDKEVEERSSIDNMSEEEWKKQGPAPQVMELEDEYYKENFDRSYKGRAVVNGIKIAVEWDINDHCYSVWLPQARKIRGADGELLSLNELLLTPATDPESAEELYQKVVKEAESSNDIEELYSRVEAAIKGMYR